MHVLQICFGTLVLILNVPLVGQSQDASRLHWGDKDLLQQVDAVSGKEVPEALASLSVEERMLYRQILDEVISTVAAFFGIPAAELNPQTDLVADLNADVMDACEVVDMIFEAQGARVPRREGLTRLDVIAFTLLKTPQKQAILTGERVRDIPPRTAIAVQEVFFATNRQPSGRSDPETFFGGNRALGPEKMRYGVCQISIPVRHERGRIERGRDPKQHIVLLNIDPMNWGQFVKTIEGILSKTDAEDWSQDILVYFHGFQTTFAKAARRTAQMAFDLNFTGIPIMFTWPSKGSVLAYFSDRVNVDWSVVYIETFLRDLKDRFPNRRIHLVAHSMGNQGLIRALNNMALRGSSPGQPLFENVIMAAPDFDTQIFTDQMAPKMEYLARKWTLYTSTHDKALSLSSKFASAKRLGTSTSVVRGVDTVDVSDVEVSPWSIPEFHSYYASKRRVIQDLISVLKCATPAGRIFVAGSVGGLGHWVLSGSEDKR